MIQKNMPIAEIVRRFPGSIELFNREHVDYCCGGKDRLEAALKDKGIDIDSFVDELNQEMSRTGNRYLGSIDESRYGMTVGELIDVIQRTHHVDERQMLRQLDQLINKILIVHFEHHGDELMRVHRLFADLKKELEEHFVMEEKVEFPLMLSQPKDPSGREALRERLEGLERDHVAVGNLLKQIQAETHDFAVPGDACPTFIGTYSMLKRLVEDIFMHVFYENTILFVKVQEEPGI